MEIWFVRHAKTAWNEDERYQGHTDTPLSSEGLNEISGWKPPVDPEVVFSSPLKRAHDTAKKLFPNKEIITDVRLREMSLGAWEGKTKSEVKALIGDMPNDGWYGLDYRDHGGETMREVMFRLQKWIEEVSQRSEKVIFVVSHKATITALYALSTGWDNLSKPNPRIRFPGFHGFQLDQKGKITPTKINVPIFGEVKT